VLSSPRAYPPSGAPTRAHRRARARGCTCGPTPECWWHTFHESDRVVGVVDVGSEKAVDRSAAFTDEPRWNNADRADPSCLPSPRQQRRPLVIDNRQRLRRGPPCPPPPGFTFTCGSARAEIASLVTVPNRRTSDYKGEYRGRAYYPLRYSGDRGITLGDLAGVRY
jgi:hypothetical protein